MNIRHFIFLKIILLVACGFMIISCNKLVPSGFWKNYHSALTVENISNHGPWGGYRIVHWESKDNDFFDIKDILKFAKSNGWSLIDSSVYSRKLPDSWTNGNKPVFPYNYDESNDMDNQVNDKFPRWIDSDFRLYSFKTGWIIIKPGTDESTERTGFVLISNDNRKLTVYHLWGE